MKSAKVYLIMSDTDGVVQWKVGVTARNIQKRINELRTANPNIVGVIDTFEAPESRCYKIESIMKRYLSTYRVDGEWFRSEALDVKRFRDMCESINKNISILEANKELVKRINEMI
jgi:hypothetical protein